MHSGSFPTLSTLIATSAFFLTSTLLPAQQADTSANERSGLIPPSKFVSTNSVPVSHSSTLKDNAAPSPTGPSETVTSASQAESNLEFLTPLLDQYQRSGNRLAEANTHYALASAYNTLRRQQMAVEQYQAALVIWRGLGNKEREALTLARIGDVYRTWGFPDHAVRFYRDAMKIFPLTTDKANEAAAINNLGVAYFSLRDTKKCLESLNQALTSYRALHNRQGEASTLVNLGGTYGFLMNDPHKALDMFQEAVTNLELLNDRASEANAQNLLGMVWLKLKKPEMATLSFQHALSLYSAVGDVNGREIVLKHLRTKTPSGNEIIAANH
jgi:tetratricopeptide (TPR) repeat protein